MEGHHPLMLIQNLIKNFGGNVKKEMIIFGMLQLQVDQTTNQQMINLMVVQYVKVLK